MGTEKQYEPRQLRTPLYGLSVRSPVDQTSTVVIEKLSEEYFQKHSDDLRRALRELGQAGVRKYVFDLSGFSTEAKAQYAAIFHGALEAEEDCHARYTGITPEEVGTDSFSRLILPKVAKTIDDAVESFATAV